MKHKKYICILCYFLFSSLISGCSIENIEKEEPNYAKTEYIETESPFTYEEADILDIEILENKPGLTNIEAKVKITNNSDQIVKDVSAKCGAFLSGDHALVNSVEDVSPSFYDNSLAPNHSIIQATKSDLIPAVSITDVNYYIDILCYTYCTDEYKILVNKNSQTIEVQEIIKNGKVDFDSANILSIEQIGRTITDTKDTINIEVTNKSALNLIGFTAWFEGIDSNGYIYRRIIISNSNSDIDIINSKEKVSISGSDYIINGMIPVTSYELYKYEYALPYIDKNGFNYYKVDLIKKEAIGSYDEVYDEED